MIDAIGVLQELQREWLWLMYAMMAAIGMLVSAGISAGLTTLRVRRNIKRYVGHEAQSAIETLERKLAHEETARQRAEEENARLRKQVARRVRMCHEAVIALSSPEGDA